MRSIRVSEYRIRRILGLAQHFKNELYSADYVCHESHKTDAHAQIRYSSLPYRRNLI